MNPNPNAETFWAHLEIVGVVLVPIFLFWLASRKEDAKRHVENVARLTKIETMVEPLWTWWNKTNGKE